MKGKHLLSIADMACEEVSEMVKRALAMKRGSTPAALRGKTVALLFEKPSLRTRVSFDVAVHELGGHPIYLNREEVGIGTRESASDVARVLSRWVDAIVARVFSHETLKLLAHHASIPVVNALSDQEHPCQALGDLLTVYEKKGRLQGATVAFVGDGNNVATSLALASASVGANFTIASPQGYEIPVDAWNEAMQRASSNGSKISRAPSPQEAVKGADVVYTDVWVSMGQEGETGQRLEDFADYQVNEELMSHAEDDAIFMHDMPAHRGEEVSEDMLDHPQSVVFDQADNRLHAQKAVLAEILGG